MISAGLVQSVSGAYQTHFIGRFSNDVWRLDLEDGPTLIAKCAYRPVRPHDHPDIERAFYRATASRGLSGSELPIPRYVGELDDVLLLEFEPLEAFSFQTGVTSRHAEQAIDALADWHAAWWGQTPEAEWLPRFDDPELLHSIQQNFDAAWQQHAGRLLESAPEFRPIGDALVGRLATTLSAMAEPATLLHGDAHAENLPLTSSGRVLLIDWQEPKVANPGYDLAVFTSMSFRQADRRSNERQLLERHADRLAAAGCRWPDPWRDYRLGLLRRAARIVEIADADFPSLPWVFRRSAMAAVELEVSELIR